MDEDTYSTPLKDNNITINTNSTRRSSRLIKVTNLYDAIPPKTTNLCKTPIQEDNTKTSSNSGGSLWLNKTPEEINDFYKKLGPNWTNEFEKTDLTIARGSPWYNKEVVPGSGIPIIPNMSREPVGIYARNLSNKKKTVFDLSTYVADINTPMTQSSARDTLDRRETLPYGPNHSPGSTISSSSRYSRSQTKLNQTNYSSQQNKVLTYNIIVRCVTSIFLYVSHIYTTVFQTTEEQQNEEQNTNSNYFVYKTRSKRSSLNKQSTTTTSKAVDTEEVTSSSSWYQSVTRWVYLLSATIVEYNFRVFLNGQSTSVFRRNSNWWKFLLMVPVCLLLGLLLFYPSFTDLSSLSLPTLPSFGLAYPSSDTLKASSDNILSYVKIIPSSLWAAASLLSPLVSVPAYLMSLPFALFNSTTKPSHSYVSLNGGQVPPEDLITHILNDQRFKLMIEEHFKAGKDIQDFKQKYEECSLELKEIKSKLQVLQAEYETSNKQLFDFTKHQIDLIDEKLNRKESCCDKLPPSITLTDVKHYVDGLLTPDRLKNTLDGAYVNQFDLEAINKKIEDININMLQPKPATFNASLIEDIKQSIKHDVYLQLENHYAAHPHVVSSSHHTQSEAKSTRTDGGEIDSEISLLIEEKIRSALATYDADKTGLTDYALESAGGHVVDIRCTETYKLKEPYYVLFGISLWKRDSNPRKAIQAGLLPGDCWAFKGAIGCLVIRLSHNIRVTKFSMEHIPKTLTPTGKIDSAPKKFNVFGLKEYKDPNPTLLGEFMYDSDGSTLQFFEALNVNDSFEMIELKILSNWGNIDYTCLYRFRVHGKLVPSTIDSTDSQNQKYTETDFTTRNAANYNSYSGAQTGKNP